jgi:superfamily II DNA or RNA helicase
LVSKIEPQNIYDTIVFVTEKQMDQCLSLLANKQIKRAKITEEESATKKVNMMGETERQSIISAFARRELQVILGIKCLDEGIDIMNARVAILMASTTNPREFIQRVGRVIRPAPNKDISIIYDMIVLPDDESSIGILEKEARRAYQIAVNAINYEDVRLKFEEKGVILDADKY